MKTPSIHRQRGGILVGLVIGLVLGLAAALVVAVYVTKVPVPFMNKTQTRTPEQDAAEQRKNQNWDPNAPLYGKNPARPQGAASAASEPAAPASAPAPAPATAPVVPAPPPAFTPSGGASAPAPAAPSAPAPGRAQGADPLGDLAAARAAAGGGDATEPFLYFVQAGAFRVPEEAEAQRAKLSLMGLEGRVSEREQSGRVVYRVRVGPLDRRVDADRIKARLESGGVEATLVRVQR